MPLFQFACSFPPCPQAQDQDMATDAAVSSGDRGSPQRSLPLRDWCPERRLKQ
ncbi:MAG: hypothetical protein ACFB0G_22015 [Leptolyngbyaceae cyanobacterium]